MGSSDGTQISKLYYRIGEVAKLLGVETSAIRHWESEFPGLRPRRTKTGQRMYSQHELQRLQEIKRLRFEQGYTIRGARQVLRSKGLEVREPQDPLVLENDHLRESLLDLRERIQHFLDELERERPQP
jgi:DNA-binding transcriptional MerR regulator